MESYRLKVNKSVIYSSIIGGIIFIIGFIVILLSHFTTTLISISIFYLAIGIINYLKYMRKPVEIEVNQNTIKFIDIFKKTTEVQFEDVEIIEVEKSRGLKIKLKNKTIFGIAAFKDFNKFIDDIKRKNSKLITIGC